MDVAITGSSGLIGSALADALHARGDRVVPVARGAGLGLRWDPDAGTIDAAGFEGLDAVVHLAGEGISEKRWTPDQKERIRESRERGTSLLATALAGLERRPSVLVSGSAVGWYGNRGEETLTEASAPPPDDDFLAEVCRAWEAATGPAESVGIRTVHIRTGIVLSADGGALAQMLRPFRLGLGGRIGSGDQYMSWISIADEVRAILFALDSREVAGAINLTAPEPATNREFTRTLGEVLHRPTLLPTPLTALRLLYGRELVQHLLVGGARVLPQRLQAFGFEFEHPTLAGALRSLVPEGARR